MLTIELMRWAHPRVDRYEPWRYWSVHRAAPRFAVRLGRCGQGNLWAPRPELLAQIRGDESDDR